MTKINLTPQEEQYLMRLVATEADHGLARRNPQAYKAQVAGIIDTVLNRIASEQFPNDLVSVANQRRQFSKITGPSNLDPYGSIQNTPASVVPDVLQPIFDDHLGQRKAGAPSTVGGHLHYANPFYSTPNNMGWINKLDGPQFGLGKSIHKHGTTAGYRPVEAVLGEPVQLADLPPERPDTALAAIDQIAPQEQPSAPQMAYAAPQQDFSKNIEKGLRENLNPFELFALRDAPEMFGSLGEQTFKVADAIGGVGRDIFQGAKDRVDEFNAPTPPRRIDKTAPAMSVGDVFAQMGAETNPITGEPIRSAPAVAEVAPVPPPAPGRLAEVGGITPPPRSANATGRQSVISRVAPQVSNAIHDLRGKRDGIKAEISNRLSDAFGQSTFGRTLEAKSLADIRSEFGDNVTIGKNGYIYLENRAPREGQREYEQIGILSSDEAARRGVKDAREGRTPLKETSVFRQREKAEQDERKPRRRLWDFFGG